MSEINFVETDIEEMTTQALAIVEGALNRKISRADPLILFIKSLLSIIVQQRELINDTGRQNLLAYARGENLDALGELVGVTRLQPAAAICTAELTLTAARSKALTVKAGTRFNAGDNVNFALDEDVTFLAGQTCATVSATCLDTGEIGNDYAAGEICKIVDPVPFLKSIKNVTIPEGGADLESDDALRERIRIAPESYSVAGSSGAYIYHAKTASELIIDVAVNSPEPGYVDVYILLENGEIPNTELLNAVQNYISADKIRPLTDFVTVKPPEIVNYNIELSYWIKRSDQTQALSIQEAVEAALDEYVLWQAGKLGRDISQTELIYKIRAAGAKRVEVISPEFTTLQFNQVAIVQNINVQYCGLENE